MNEYEHRKDLLEELRPRVKTLIRILSKEHGVEVHDVQARVKEKSSLKKKIEEKQGKYHDLKDITDTVGIRVITYFHDDVDKIAQVIENEFQVDRENSVDKRVMDPDRFGYSSLHYVVEFKDERLKFLEYKDFSGIKFEIQIRSILQHAWAEIEHDLGYKSSIEVPKNLRRSFSRIAGLLEIADLEFLRVKKEIKEYTEVVSIDIKEKKLSIPLDKVSLNEFINDSPIVRQIDEDISSIINIPIGKNFDRGSVDLKRLQFLGIESIKQLNEELLKNSELIIDFAEKLLLEDDVHTMSTIRKGISIFYLAYVLIGTTRDVSYVEKYLNQFDIEEGQLRKEFAQEIVGAFSKEK